VDELIEGVSKTHPIDMDFLEKVVATDDKQRFSFNDDKTLIRANQGHSIDVDVELEKLAPPQYLWHGTAEKYVESIEKSGLLPKTRLYVHLSADIETAKKVGVRHGKTVVYRVDAQKMHSQGIDFYKSANQVWLVKSVPTEFLEKFFF
jgi:putative RNA 2'-phosphotransferase